MFLFYFIYLFIVQSEKKMLVADIWDTFLKE